MSPWIPVGLGAFAAVLFVIERLAPLRRPTVALWPRCFVNLAMATLAYLVSATVIRPAVALVLLQSASLPWGLVTVLPDVPLLREVVSFLLMDLTFYYWHRANHRLPLLWRFHAAHHNDPDLDVSTSFRFHAGEMLLSAAFTAAQVAVIGLSASTYAVFTVVFQATTLLQHSNVRLPLPLERVLNLLLVTPRMHGVHHSEDLAESNSNFSVIFSWWDRLHRTFCVSVPQAQLRIGVAGLSAQACSLPAVLKLPFGEVPRCQPPSAKVTERQVMAP